MNIQFWIDPVLISMQEGPKGPKGSKGHKGHKVHKGHKDHKGHKGCKGYKGHKGSKVPKGLKGLNGLNQNNKEIPRIAPLAKASNQKWICFKEIDVLCVGPAKIGYNFRKLNTSKLANDTISKNCSSF